MGNLFIGFPVPRAKIADMIATAAPPTLHHADHEDGGKDEIDVTGLEGGGGLTLPWDDIYFNEILQSKNCLYSSVGTSGVISEAGDGVTIDTGTDVNSHAAVYKYLAFVSPALTWPKARTLIINVDFSGSDGGNDGFLLVCGRRANYKHIGFKVVSQVMYGTCYNGSESTVQLTGGAKPAFSYGEYSLKFVYDGAASVKFYLNGVERGEITTNIPSASSYANRPFDIYCETLTEGWHAAIRLNSYSFYQGA